MGNILFAAAILVINKNGLPMAEALSVVAENDVVARVVVLELAFRMYPIENGFYSHRVSLSRVPDRQLDMV